jgi:lipopolysaccharide export system protein LptA
MLENKIWAAIFCLITSTVYAEKSDRVKPMDIEANHASLDQKSQLSVFTGNVMMVQGTMRLLANKVMIREDKEGNQYSEGQGTPVKFRQKMDNSPDYIEAQALRFTYDGKTGILKLYDKAWVRRGKDEVKGDIITYDMQHETYDAHTQQASRVNVTITPKEKAHKSKPSITQPSGKPAY